jgi:hypothetical protein
MIENALEKPQTKIISRQYDTFNQDPMSEVVCWFEGIDPSTDALQQLPSDLPHLT